MRHGFKGRRLNRTSAHRKAMFANMINAIIKHEQVVTSLQKAKEIRPLIDKVITLGKNHSLSNRRRALSWLGQKTMVKKVFDVLAKRYENRNGGYSRVVKLGFRKGDMAPTAVIELVDRDDRAAKGKDSGPVIAKKTRDDEQESDQDAR